MVQLTVLLQEHLARTRLATRFAVLHTPNLFVSRARKGNLTSPATSTRLHYSSQERLLQCGRLNFQQIGSEIGDTTIRDHCVPVIGFDEVDISKPQDRSEDAEYGTLLVVGKTNNIHRSLGVSVHI